MPARSTDFTAHRATGTRCWLGRLGLLVLGTLGVCVAGGCASLLGGSRADEVAAARAISLRGQNAVERGQWSEAETLFVKAIAQCPVDERSRCHYAEVLWHRGAEDEAIEQMREAVRLSGGNPSLTVRLGEMYLARRNLALAAAQADEVIRRQAELPRAWALHGDVLLRQGKGQEALASYHRALSYQEHFPRVQLAVAEIYRREGRPDRALGTVMALSDQYPTGEVPASVLAERGLALKELRRYDEAVRDLNRVRELGAATADVLFQLGEAQLLAGDPLNAHVALLGALEKSPRHAGARRMHQYLESRHPGLTASLRGRRVSAASLEDG